MLKINQIKLPLTADEHDLRRAAGKALRLDENRIRTLRVTKKDVYKRQRYLFSPAQRLNNRPLRRDKRRNGERSGCAASLP